MEGKNLGEKAELILDSTDEKSVEIISKRAKIHKYHISEGILLAWLEYHFKEECKKGWLLNCHDIYNPNENEDEIKLKLFDNFDSCLTDGLVFIALTRAHCPFLINEFFRNIYVCPRTLEEVKEIHFIIYYFIQQKSVQIFNSYLNKPFLKFNRNWLRICTLFFQALHNAICVVAAWKKIRLCFFVKPMQIVRPNCVHMLMLVTHLYTVLPTYMAKTKVGKFFYKYSNEDLFNL